MAKSVSIGARGEATLKTANGNVYILFTNRAIANAEGMMGKSIINALNRDNFGMSELAYLLLAGMQCAKSNARISGRGITLEDAYEVIDTAGFTQTANAVTEAVAAVISYEPAQEADPNA